MKKQEEEKSVNSINASYEWSGSVLGMFSMGVGCLCLSWVTYFEMFLELILPIAPLR